MKTSLLIFGGGPLQISIIKKAKLLGYRTIVIDPNIQAPASEIADVFFSVNGNNFEQTKQIAIDYNVKGIITSATDKPILMMCRIAKELKLPFPSFTSCETILDKSKFKHFLKTNNFPFAKGSEHKGINSISPQNITFPVIIKPAINSGSRGVFKCENAIELKIAINETLKFCNDDRYLIEEYIEGDEISVEALVQENKVHILQITDKIVTPPPYNVELGHIQPSKYEYMKPNIEKILQSLIKKIGLNNTAIHPEFKIKDDKITIIEIGPRMGGDFITSHLVPLSTGINMEEQLINISIGSKIKFELDSKAAMVNYLNFPIDKKVKRTITNNEIKNKFSSIIEFSFDLKIGEETRQITNSLNRYGQFIIAGNDTQSLISQNNEINKFLIQYIL